MAFLTKRALSVSKGDRAIYPSAISKSRILRRLAVQRLREIGRVLPCSRDFLPSCATKSDKEKHHARGRSKLFKPCACVRIVWHDDANEQVKFKIFNLEKTALRICEEPEHVRSL